MTQLNRFQMAACKRTAQNTKKLVSQKEKLTAKLREMAEELVQINEQIEAWEGPIKKMTGGYTSEQMIEWDGKIPEVNETEIPEVSEESTVVAEVVEE